MNNGCNSNLNLENPQSNEQNELEVVLKEEFDKLKKKYEEQVDLNKAKDSIIQDLEQKNIELKAEASKYQSALGTATNLRLSDDDENNPVTLKKDILKLQDSLEDYITTCKGDVEINLNEIQKLLKKYGSQTTITKDQKPLIKAVLQRHVIEEIFEYSEEYFSQDSLSYYKFKKFASGIETYMYNRARELIYLSKTFGENRDGVDKTTKVLSVRLRQQIFTALGNRGFNKVINSENQIFPNNIIDYYQKRLNREINKYRTIKNSERKLEIEEKAGGVIQKIITIFWFRLEVQEPIARYIWFKHNDKINPSYMEGTWEKDEIDDRVVDICYFPLIAQEFDNESKRQIYTRAKIFHESQQKN